MKPAAYLYQLQLRPLPEWALLLLETQHAPPRLIAHAHIVADVAAQLVDALHLDYPLLAIDVEAVIAGAALHDIGKVVYPVELSAAGHQHEQAGYELLLRQGVPERYARFAQTHGAWKHRSNASREDMLVALADTCWKGKRDTVLEEMIVARIPVDADAWQVWLAFDDHVERIAGGAAARLAWQAQFSARADAAES